MSDNDESYLIALDQEWELGDLYEFPHALNQAYAFYYWLNSEEVIVTKRIDAALQAYPWQGGYSIVNFYSLLQRELPDEDRPLIVSIRYESPGWLELLINQETMASVAQSVDAILRNAFFQAVAGIPAAAKSIELTVRSAERITSSYAKIQDTLGQIKRQKAKDHTAQLVAQKHLIHSLYELAQEFSKLLGFKNFEQLVQRAGSVEVAAKLVSAQYLRLNTMAAYVEAGKVHLSGKKPISKSKATTKSRLKRDPKPK